MIVDVPQKAWLSQESIHKDRERYTILRPLREDRRQHRSLSFFKDKRILLWTRKPGLGDMVMNAICCDILRRQHGLDVWYGCRYNPYDREFPEFLKAIPCYRYQPDLRVHPLPQMPRGYEGGIDHVGQNHPFDFIMDFRYHIGLERNTIFQCLEEFGVNRLPVPCQGLPVHNLPKVERSYDVVLALDCGGWKPVRSYRRVTELEQKLREAGLSVLNLSRAVMKPALGLVEILAHVKAAKLFIGVETGITHLVSGVHRKALVVQSGIHRSAFWNVYSNTYVIEANWPCGGRKCRVRKHEECKVDGGVCIDRFAPSDIATLAISLM
jgi:hypothetical protein